MHNPEIILNLWAIHDPDDGIIYGLAGRAYFASGTDEQKRALLKQLAVSDFVLAVRLPVPERFCIESVGATMHGVCRLNELYNPATTLFDDMFRELGHEIRNSNQADSEGDVIPDALKISENPLFVITALVEGEDGVIRAVPGDGKDCIYPV
jgi:hypothetical protein